MTTVHIENTVRDFDAWKAAFDKYARFRAQHGVQSCRVSRGLTEPQRVLIDLDFDDEATAAAFLPRLTQIWNSPQSRSELIGHEPPRLYTLISAEATTP